MWVQIPLLSLKLQTWRLLRARSSLTFRQNIECRLTLKLVLDMILIYSQYNDQESIGLLNKNILWTIWEEYYKLPKQCSHFRDKYSQHSSNIWPFWQNGRVFIYELSGCGFKSHRCHLNFRYGACLEKGVTWYSGKI